MNYVDLLDRKVGVSPAAAVEFSKDAFPASFPFARWTTQAVRYNDYWAWFTGAVWEETVKGAKDKNGDPVYKFPLKINLIKSAAMKHSYVLFGEVPDGPGPLVPCRVKPEENEEEEAPDPEIKKKAKRLQNTINRIWEENNGRTLQRENGVVSQVLGGCVFKAKWDPLNTELRYKIKLEMVLPDFFMPVWDSTNPDDLLEAFIIWRMPAREAMLKYGYDPSKADRTKQIVQNPDFVLYIEHWTKTTISITVGGQTVEQYAEEIMENGEIDQAEVEFDEAENPFGFIPMVYIPRERAGSYYGLSMIDDLKGLAKEYNSRMADLGDVIAESSHREVFVRNTPGTIRTRDIGGLRAVTDLGGNGPNQKEPDAFAIDPPAIPAGLADFPEHLREQYLRDASVSKVAEGEDEGSQRSALTLAFRMWPITSKARATRDYWTSGLNRFNRMIARIAALNPEETGIKQDDLDGVEFHCAWAPQVPRDREQMVNEVTLLLQSDALSPVTALQTLNTVDDPYEEIEKIKEWKEYLNGLAMDQEKNKAQAKTAVQAPVASTGLDNK